MCGSVSAIGLGGHEREWWPYLRERLRVPGHFMALMRGVLGDAEVAAVVAVTADGAVKPVAILALPEEIAQEIELAEEDAGAGAGRDGLRRARIGDDEVDVLVQPDANGPPRPLAVLATPWIDQHLLLYARTLWHRRRPTRSSPRSGGDNRAGPVSPGPAAGIRAP